MALHWDMSKVKDLHELHNTAPNGGERPHPEGSLEDFIGDREWDISNSLIWATMAVDMGEITEKNYEEFYRRLRMVGKVYGSPYLVTLADVKRRIGLSTNVTTKTAAQFENRMKMALAEDADRHLSAERRALAEYDKLMSVPISDMSDDDVSRLDKLTRNNIRKHILPVVEEEDARRNAQKEEIA